MTQRQLKIFKTLAETLNFTKTAEQLYLSQTTVTLQIHNLEEELGAKLFERTSRSVRLTAAGNVFLDAAVAILKMMDQAVENTRNVAKGYNGLLRIGFAADSNATGISEMMMDFQEKHPDIRLQYYGGYPRELLDMLRVDNQDIILTPSFERLRTKDLKHHRIGNYKPIAVFHKKHQFSKRTVLRYNDFAKEKFIKVATAEDEMDFSKRFFKRLEDLNIPYEIAATTENIASILFILEVNLAVTILPEYFLERFHGSSQILTCEIDENLDGTDFLATWKAGGLTKELKLFIDFMEDHFPGGGNMAEQNT